MSTGRTWLLTYNNPEFEPQEWLEKLYVCTKARYVVGQLEIGESGTKHVQAYANYSKPIRPSALKKFDMKMHIDLVKVDNGALAYCMKEETRVAGPWSYGEKPVKRNSKEDWNDVWENAKLGKFDNIPKDILVRHYSNIKQIAKDNMKIEDKDGLRGIWVYGKAGAGKSRWAREQAGDDFYPKLCNKWWDGYKGQSYVIMDDIGKDHKVLGQQLKIWSDRYGCILETKGGAVVDNYRWFIVTSQYEINQIWDDKETQEALERRFQEFNIDNIKGLKLGILDK